MRRLLEIWSLRSESKNIWKKYTNIETMKIISIFGIYQAIYHNGSYLVLFL